MLLQRTFSVQAEWAMKQVRRQGNSPPQGFPSGGFLFAVGNLLTGAINDHVRHLLHFSIWKSGQEGALG
jgi:hypothetical protein